MILMMKMVVLTIHDDGKFSSSEISDLFLHIFRHKKGYINLFVSCLSASELFFCRCDASDSSGADKFYKKAAEHRDVCKPLLADIVEETLGNDNSMSDEVLDNLLQRSEILKEICAMANSMKNNDRAGEMSAVYNLLTYLGNAR